MSIKAKPIKIAQISDCHLFGDINSLHHGVDVYKNLTKVIHHISTSSDIELIVFTGDLTQDHSDESYQRFVDVFEKQKVITPEFSVPVYYLAGNHDELILLDKYLSKTPFNADKTINLAQWQLQLIQSKSDTPAGLVSDETLKQLKCDMHEDKYQLIFMHHHPVDVGFFIDKHGLKNKDVFWQGISKINLQDMIKGIACGHIHRGLNIPACSANKNQSATVFTCPATSIQFDPEQTSVTALNQGPGYRIFTLEADGELSTQLIYL